MSEPHVAFGAVAGVGELFQFLRDGKSRTRSELSELVGVPRNRVALQVDALVAAGLATPAGSAASTGGRPSALVTFNPEGGRILAMDIGANHARVAVTDLTARILASSVVALDLRDGPTAVLDLVTAEGLVLDRSTAHLGRLVGVGIGVPGAVEHRSGRPISPPIMPGWDGFDIPAHVTRSFDVPVLVDNDVNILAIGERSIRWPQVDDLIYVKVATGLGAGVIAGGHLQRGAQGSAGEMGHVRVPFSRDSPRDPDDERELGGIASGSAIVEQLRSRGRTVSGTSDLAGLVVARDDEAMRLIRQAGREVGEVLATLVNVLNPAVIVIGGSVARAGEDLIAGVREVVYRRSLTLATANLIISPTGGDDTAGAVGAATMVAERVLSPGSVEAWVASQGVLSPS